MNVSDVVVDSTKLSSNDAAWILGNSFRILTMQTGFGMLEVGCVSAKNVANIMFKNIVDVSLGGITYWMFGYGLSFGNPSNTFCGFGDFFFNGDNYDDSGSAYSKYFFHFCFATAATTIVSGAVAERMKLTAYIIFSVMNVFIYCIPASWVWNEKGFLYSLGFYDFAGAAVVHMSGGCSALAAAILLGPRLDRFDSKDGKEKADPSVGSMNSPVTALTGTFMLWWAWMAFNCGSTFGIRNNHWKVAAKVAVTTVNASIGGSISALMMSLIVHRKHFYFRVDHQINAILGGLVGVTAGCPLFTPAESLLVGFIAGIISVSASSLLEKFRIDDPVGAIPVHLFPSIWGTLAIGIFGRDTFKDAESNHFGFLYGWNFHQLGVQAIGTGCIIVWATGLTFLVLLILKKTMGIRMSMKEEVLGADWVEHQIRSESFAAKLEKNVIKMNISKENESLFAKKILTEIAAARRKSTTVKVDGKIRNYAGSTEDERKEKENTVKMLYNVITPPIGSKKPKTNKGSTVDPLELEVKNLETVQEESDNHM